MAHTATHRQSALRSSLARSRSLSRSWYLLVRPALDAMSQDHSRRLVPQSQLYPAWPTSEERR